MLITHLGSLVPRHGQSAIATYMRHEGNTRALQIKRDHSSRCALQHARKMKKVNIIIHIATVYLDVRYAIGSFEGRTLS